MKASDPYPESSSIPKSGVTAKFWKLVPGYTIAIACLVWIFHDIQMGKLMDSMVSINWWWIVGAVLFDVGSYVSQGKRWSLLMHPLGKISTYRSTEAIYAGLFVNEMLPMRLGEVLRIYLVSRWIGVRFALVIPSILVERFFDAIWLALAFGVTVFTVPLPRYLVDAEWVLGIAALAMTALLAFLVFGKKKMMAQDSSGFWNRWRPVRWIAALVNKMVGGIRDIGQSRDFYSSFVISLFLLLGQIIAFWFVMRSYDLRLSFWHGAAIFLIVHVGTIIPGAPSNIGTYQFFTVVGLTLFGIDKTLATSFSIVVFLILTLPLWVIGMIIFGRLGLSLKDVKTEIAALAKIGFRPGSDPQ